MNAERLHAIAIAIQEDLNSSGVVGLIDQLVSALQNQVNQPGQPQFQQQVGQLFGQVSQALEKSKSNDFSPTWKQVIGEIGFEPYLGLTLKNKLDEIFSRNQITSVIALDELIKIRTILQELHNATGQLLSSYSQFKIGYENLKAGECEVGVLIPRAFVENRIDRFAIEINEINKMLGVFSEISIGSRPSFEIKTISSSDFSIFVQAHAHVAACISVAIERVVALYKNLLEIRKLKLELSQQGLNEDRLKVIGDHANETMEQGLVKLTEEIVRDFYTKTDDGRKRELSIELNMTLKKLAKRIDRGFNLEVKIGELPHPAKESGKEGVEDPAQARLQKDHQQIQLAAKGMQFLKLEGEPLLSLSDSSSPEPMEPPKP